LRFGIGRALGWDSVRSDLYQLGVRNGALVFDGRGHGHGVGLCQEGAAEMAAEGRSARDILAFYFPGTAVRILPGDGGWQEIRAGALRLTSTYPLTAERKAELTQTWGDAQRLFPPRRTIAAEVVFAPSTEVFRQLTTEPGWALASTRGGVIVLQPEEVLHARGRDASITLLHEMLHVLVEAEADGRSPLWLREGLVEVLAGEPVEDVNMADRSTMAGYEIDSALLHADSLRESQRAHRAAAARVGAAIGRYGLPAVRGWLSTGVPAGAA
jgi:stage II sporulation protein D